MGINEFYKNILGKKLKNPMAWGAILPSGTVALNVWEQEIIGGRVDVHSEAINRTKNGSINNNWNERKSHFNLIKSGVPAVGVLISNGDKQNSDGSWNIKDFNEDSIFPLSDLRCNENLIWTMKIDLTKPIRAEAHTIDVAQELKVIQLNFVKAYTTVKKAMDNFGWRLIGVTDESVTLANESGDKLMHVSLPTGSYKVVKP